MSAASQISSLRASLPRGVTLVAVSKTRSAERIMEAYGAGQRIFGESRPQEMTAKRATLPDDIQWHMIGHLQTNKVRMIAPYVALIHSVDSERLLQTIDAEAARIGRRIDVLLEVFVASEQSKHGWDEAELMDWIAAGEHLKLNNIRIRGLMGIASNTDDAEAVGAEFARLRTLFDRLKDGHFDVDCGEREGTKPCNDEAWNPLASFDTLSMGMTSDYRQAIGHGSTMVRIGSMIFGAR